MAKSNRTPNDQRSDAHNSTSSESKASNDNRSNQMNPQHPSYSKSRSK